MNELEKTILLWITSVSGILVTIIVLIAEWKECKERCRESEQNAN
jgi:hypothetical protein